MSKQPLPDFLKDLTFTLDGEAYRLFPVPKRDNWFVLGLKDYGYYANSLFVNFDEEMAEIKDSHSIRKYRAGQTKLHTHWDDREPQWDQAEPFEAWIRENVLKDIHRQLSWHMERTFSKSPDSSNIEVYERLCKDFAQLPNFEFPDHPNGSLRFSLLAAIHRSRCSGSVTETDRAIFVQFIDEIKTGDLFEREEHHFLSLTLNLLPTVPDIIMDYYEEILSGMYDASECKNNEVLQFTSYWVENLKNKGTKERNLHHKHLLPICTTTTLCHAMAAGLFEWPDEAELYFDKGLSLKPDNISLLVIAETFYLNHSRSDMLEKIRLRIKAMDVKAPSTKNIQSMIDRYTQLCNDYQYFDPSTDSRKTARELLKLEAKLNTYWFNLLPNPKSLSRQIVEEQLIEQKRFLSAGSASICGWMRNQQRYQEVVDYMMPLCNQLELCTLRHKTYATGFETFVNNGLSCFLDSQNATHIKQAIQIVNALETIIPEWVTGLILYTFVCITARANQLDRCIEYVVLALEKGESIQSMAQDVDCQNVWQHPRFLELVDSST